MSNYSDKDQITAYPLQWPLSQPRTEPGQRQYARFGTRAGSGYGTRQLTLAQACQRIYTEVVAWTRAGRTWRIDPDDLIISTNVALRLDGRPRSGQRAPEDPGAAAYFVLDGDNYCLPCDRWLRVEDNIAAIAGHLGAMCAMDRWGVGNVQTHFAGFKSLPAPGTSVVQTWANVLGVEPDCTLVDAKAAYRKMASETHPDKGGSADQFERVRKAWVQAQAALKQ